MRKIMAIIAVAAAALCGCERHGIPVYKDTDSAVVAHMEDGYMEQYRSDDYDEQQRLDKQHGRRAVRDFRRGEACPIQTEFVATGQLLKAIVEQGEYDSIMVCLDRLRLPEGCSLHVQPPERDGSGGESRVYVTDGNGDTTDRIFDVIEVEDSPAGAMQAYLLFKTRHYLPLWWHSNYARRVYLYSEEEVGTSWMQFVEEPSKMACKIRKKDLAPAVARNDGRYYISCCFWSDFGGLIRELVEVEIRNGKAVGFFDADYDKMIYYHCHVMF